MSERTTLPGESQLGSESTSPASTTSNGRGASLTVQGRTTELPLVRGSEGEEARP